MYVVSAVDVVDAAGFEADLRALIERYGVHMHRQAVAVSETMHDVRIDVSSRWSSPRTVKIDFPGMTIFPTRQMRT
jgi:hypothetical protein